MNRAFARNTDPITSLEAADSLTPDALTDLQRKVMDKLRAHPFGLTVPEIAAAVDLPRDTISPRMKTLVDRRLVEDSGVKMVPPGHTRSCIVWRVKP